MQKIDLSQLRRSPVTYPVAVPPQPARRVAGGAWLLLAGVLLYMIANGGVVPDGDDRVPVPSRDLHVLVVFEPGKGTKAQADVTSSSRWVEWAKAKPAEFRRHDAGQDLTNDAEIWREMRKLALTPPAIVVANKGRAQALPVPDTFEAAVAAVENVR